MSDVKLFTGGRVILPDRILEDGCVLTRGDSIEEVGEKTEVSLPPHENVEIIDAGGDFVSPGFVDIHVHGGAGSDFSDGTTEDLANVTRFHAAGGVTSVVATTASMSTEQILKALDVIAHAKSLLPDGSRVLGAHLEGPYLLPEKRGCHLESQVRNPDPEEVSKFVERADHVISMTCAPDLPGAEEMIESLRAAGIVISAGHSNASYGVMMQAIEWGVTHTTHLYCAMSSFVTFSKPFVKREGGIVEAIFLDDKLTTEVISDGIHVSDDMLRMAHKIKGPERVAIVSDAMRGAGMPDGEYTFGPRDGQKAIVKNRESRVISGEWLASSTFRLNEMVQVYRYLVGAPLHDIVRMASLTPAEIVKQSDRLGSLEKGKHADVIIFDDDIEVKRVFIGGVEHDVEKT
ncbi:N-acetylglucosamine-6-phosphate deacetylase [bacterium]|nr:N-acetylglucosamine-6-phosphate deacetylase [bacterium]